MPLLFLDSYQTSALLRLGSFNPTFVAIPKTYDSHRPVIKVQTLGSNRMLARTEAGYLNIAAGPSIFRPDG